MLTEQCNNATVSCTDWNAEYNSDVGYCNCISGYTDSPEGCVPWTELHASSAILAELERRMDLIYDSGVLDDTFSAQNKTGMDAFLVRTERRLTKKLPKYCSRLSLLLHGKALDGLSYIKFQKGVFLRNGRDPSRVHIHLKRR